MFGGVEVFKCRVHLNEREEQLVAWAFPGETVRADPCGTCRGQGRRTDTMFVLTSIKSRALPVLS